MKRQAPNESTSGRLLQNLGHAPGGTNPGDRRASAARGAGREQGIRRGAGARVSAAVGDAGRGGDFGVGVGGFALLPNGRTSATKP